MERIAKRPAYQAAMAAREGRPAKGPPRLYCAYEKLFSKTEMTRQFIPVGRVEKYQDGFVVIIHELPKPMDDYGHPTSVNLVDGKGGPE